MRQAGSASAGSVLAGTMIRKTALLPPCHAVLFRCADKRAMLGQVARDDALVAAYNAIDRQSGPFR